LQDDLGLPPKRPFDEEDGRTPGKANHKDLNQQSIDEGDEGDLQENAIVHASQSELRRDSSEEIRQEDLHELLVLEVSQSALQLNAGSAEDIRHEAFSDEITAKSSPCEPSGEPKEGGHMHDSPPQESIVEVHQGAVESECQSRTQRQDVKDEGASLTPAGGPSPLGDSKGEAGAAMLGPKTTPEGGRSLAVQQRQAEQRSPPVVRQPILDRMKEEAMEIVRIRAKWGAVLSFAKVLPFSDSIMLKLNEGLMLFQICEVFGMSLGESFCASLIGGEILSTGATVVGKYLVSRVFKWLMNLVPGANLIQGGFDAVTAHQTTLMFGMGAVELVFEICSRCGNRIGEAEFRVEYERGQAARASNR
jgi:uncharacterized protein (DUF697 family)